VVCLIYVIGSSATKNTLKNFDTATDPYKAKCLVVEVPGYLSELNHLQDLSIACVFVVTGMVNLIEWRFIKDHDIATLQNVPGIIQSHLNTLEENNDKYEITFNDQPENSRQLENEPVQEQYNTQARQHETFNQQKKRGTILAFFSAAGGVGKTFTSINVAGTAALNDIETVVVDMDFGFGDIDTATGLVDPTQRERVIDKKATVPKTGWATVPEWRHYAQTLKTSRPLRLLQLIPGRRAQRLKSHRICPRHNHSCGSIR